MRRKPPAPHPGALLLKKLKRQMTADSARGILSIKELCAKYDCTFSTLRILLKDQGAASNKRLRVKVTYKAPPPGFMADARRGVLTRKELATKYKLSYGAASAHIREARIAVPRALTKLPARDTADRARRKLRMRALYAKGRTLEEIGASYGISRERVRQILARAARDAGEARAVRGALPALPKAIERR